MGKELGTNSPDDILQDKLLDAEWIIYSLEYTENDIPEHVSEHLSDAFYNDFDNDSQKKSLWFFLRSNPLLELKLDKNTLIQIDFIKKDASAVIKLWSDKNSQKIKISKTVKKNIKLIIQTMNTILENTQNVTLVKSNKVSKESINKYTKCLLSMNPRDFSNFIDELSLYIHKNCLGLDVELWKVKIPISIINKFIRLTLIKLEWKPKQKIYYKYKKYTESNLQNILQTSIDLPKDIEDWVAENYQFDEALIKSVLTYDPTFEILKKYLKV